MTSDLNDSNDDLNSSMFSITSPPQEPCRIGTSSVFTHSSLPKSILISEDSSQGKAHDLFKVVVVKHGKLLLFYPIYYVI